MTSVQSTLSVGDRLKAKIDLKSLSGYNLLTKNNVYEIISIGSPAYLELSYYIIDDEGDNHEFDAAVIPKFFEVIKWNSI